MMSRTKSIEFVQLPFVTFIFRHQRPENTSMYPFSNFAESSVGHFSKWAQ